MNQKAAGGKTPASKPTGGKSAPVNSMGRKMTAAGSAIRTSAAATSPAPALKSPPMDAATTHNRELQLNTNNERFWKARGYDERPADWKTRDPSADPKRS